MKISVPVVLTVEVEFDVDEDENGKAVLDTKDVEALIASTREAVQDVLHESPGFADDMVERVTENTGWCIKAFSYTSSYEIQVDNGT